MFFSTDMGPWNKTGFNGLNYLVSACDKHQRLLNHIRAFSALQTFGSQRIDHSLNLQKKIHDEFLSYRHNQIFKNLNDKSNFPLKRPDVCLPKYQ